MFKKEFLVNMPSSRWCTRYVPLIFWFGHQVIVHVMGVHYVKVFWNIKPSWSNGRGIYPPKWQKDNNLAAILKMYPCHNCPKKHFFDYNSIFSRKSNIYFMRNMLGALE